jgi:hypothetical protein
MKMILKTAPGRPTMSRRRLLWRAAFDFVAMPGVSAFVIPALCLWIADQPSCTT